MNKESFQSHLISFTSEPVNLHQEEFAFHEPTYLPSFTSFRRDKQRRHSMVTLPVEFSNSVGERSSRLQPNGSSMDKVASFLRPSSYLPKKGSKGSLFSLFSRSSEGETASDSGLQESMYSEDNNQNDYPSSHQQKHKRTLSSKSNQPSPYLSRTNQLDFVPGPPKRIVDLDGSLSSFTARPDLLVSTLERRRSSSSTATNLYPTKNVYGQQVIPVNETMQSMIPQHYYVNGVYITIDDTALIGGKDSLGSFTQYTMTVKLLKPNVSLFKNTSAMTFPVYFRYSTLRRMYLTLKNSFKQLKFPVFPGRVYIGKSFWSFLEVF